MEIKRKIFQLNFKT